MHLDILNPQFSSVAQSCPTLCDPMNRSTPGLPVHHQHQEFTQTHATESMMPSSHLILCRPLSSCPQSFPASGSFPMSQLFAWGGQSTGVSALASFLPKSQGWSPYSCHLFLISSASVRSIQFLSFIKPIFAWNVPLVSLIFLEETSSLSPSLVFHYFFALITEEGFLFSPCCSLELCIQMGVSFLFSFAFSKTSLNIWKFMVHVLLSLAWRILRITLLECEMNAIVW